MVFILKRINVFSEKIKQSKVLPDHTHGRPKITPKKAVLMTVWYLSNQETFRQVSDRFNVTKSSAHRVIKKVINYFVQNSRKFIRWPNEDGKAVIRQGFKDIQNIDNIVGAIDGCHILIKRPLENAHVYCNRKSQHSILLQAVCDHKKRFIDVFCGEAGSIHDARLLKKSSLYDRGINGLLGNDFLIGDSAYPCLQWLIPPFRDNGQLTHQQKTFNHRHSSSRIVIEHAFGLLKSRFRKLKFFENDNIIFIVKCVVAATVLHNICLEFNDEVDYHLEDNDDEDFHEDFVINITGVMPTTARRDAVLNVMFNR